MLRITIFLALLTILNYFVGKRRALYPPFIDSFIWFADAALFLVRPYTRSTRFTPITWWVIALGALVFSIGGWLTRLVPRAVITTRVRELSLSNGIAARPYHPAEHMLLGGPHNVVFRDSTWIGGGWDSPGGCTPILR